MAPPAAEPRLTLLEDPRQLLQEPLLTSATTVVVALSGGLDSSVLLHLCTELRTLGFGVPLRALHVQHGLQDAAEGWAAHCAALCEKLKVPLTIVRLGLRDAGLHSEAAAREARYEAFAQHLSSGAVLLQAHHQQDQVETVLFRLARGSGVKGLAGIPRQRPFAQGWLFRPLLETPRAELEAYAQAHRLRWVEDPTNAEPTYSRNFLRQRVLPTLREHWPALDEQVVDTARLCAEASELMADLARADLDLVQGQHPRQLSVGKLLSLSAARRNNLLRHWVTQVLGEAAPQPGLSVLDRVVSELLGANDDAAPVLRWGATGQALTLRRYDGSLYLVEELPPVPSPMTLRVGKGVELPAPLGRLSWRESRRDGLNLAADELLQVRFRTGGERIKPAGRPTREVKKLLQEFGVAPWLRAYVPLIYRGEELIAVADLVVAEHALAQAGDTGLHLVWERPDLHCGC